MTRVALLGATGFVGGVVATALRRRGADVVPVRAPRLTSNASSAADLGRELGSREVGEIVARLHDELDGCQAVVNAAGVASATRGLTPELVGGNALLPLVVDAARTAQMRFVHISSAAVQGRRPVLDESLELAPFSPYSWAKALAEQALASRAGVVLYRPASVHAAGREVTRTMSRVVSSPLASVAGRGDGPTPQALAANVGDGVAFVTLCRETPPRVVLHPWEGLTTEDLVRRVGGRDPRHVPEQLARALVTGGHRLGRHQALVAGLARRLEMMWFGQGQEPGWLQSRWSPPVDPSGWEQMR